MALVNKQYTDTGSKKNPINYSKTTTTTAKQVTKVVQSSASKIVKPGVNSKAKVTTVTTVASYTDTGTSGNSATKVLRGLKDAQLTLHIDTSDAGYSKGYLVSDTGNKITTTFSGNTNSNKNKKNKSDSDITTEQIMSDAGLGGGTASGGTSTGSKTTGGKTTGGKTTTGNSSTHNEESDNNNQQSYEDTDINSQDITVWYNSVLVSGLQKQIKDTDLLGGLSLDKIPDQLNNVIPCYIIHLGAQKWMPLPMYPEQVSEGVSASWSTTSIPGRAADYYTYTGTGNRSISFNLRLHYDLLTAWGSTADKKYYMTQILNFLKACVYPHYTASNINVPVCILKLSDSFKLRGVFTSVNITHQLPMRLVTKHFKPDSKLNLYTYYDVTCSFVEVPTYCPDYTRIAEYGGGTWT